LTTGISWAIAIILDKDKEKIKNVMEFNGR
jgi:hypothetical protein